MTTSDVTTTNDTAQPNPVDEPTPSPFNIGDIVYLKGNSVYRMTVEGLFTHPGDNKAWIIAVAWFDPSAQLQHAQFHPSALVLA